MELYRKVQPAEGFVFSASTAWPLWFNLAVLEGRVVIEGKQTGLARAFIDMNSKRVIIFEGQVLVKEGDDISIMPMTEVLEKYTDVSGKAPELPTPDPRAQLLSDKI